MTTLEQSIKTALPYLMELGKGCEIIDSDKNKAIIFKVFDEKYICVCYDPPRLDFHLIENVEILGKPIALPDVLRWLNAISKDVTYAIEADGCFLINTGTEWTAVTYMNGNSNEVVFWNLTIPNLSDQPQPVKDFLSNLIEK